MPGGRLRASEWTEVLIIENSSKVLCSYCGAQLSNKIERIRFHLASCDERRTSAPNAGTISVDESHSARLSKLKTRPIKRKPDKLSSEPLAGTSGTSSLSSDKADSVKFARTSDVPLILPAKTVSTVDTVRSDLKLAVKMADTRRRLLDEQVARFIFANDLESFDIAESKEFRAMVDALHPGYRPPNRTQLCGYLLESLAQELDEKFRVSSKAAILMLIMDGFSSGRKDAGLLTCTVISNGTSSCLMSAADSIPLLKTAAHCGQLAIDAITRVRSVLDQDVFAVCCDAENSELERIRDLLLAAHADLLVYGCSAYHLSSVQAVLFSQTAMMLVAQVQQYFSQDATVLRWLLEKGGSLPLVNSGAGLKGHVECLRSFVDNLPIYEEIRVEHAAQFDPGVANVLSNSGIQPQAQLLHKQVGIISTALERFRTERATLSTAVDVWFELFQQADLQPYRTELEIHFERAVEPFHLLAYMMDPRFRGRHLTTKHEEDAEQWLARRKPDFLPFVLAFRIEDEELFPKTLFAASIVKQFTVANWWKLMDAKTVKARKLPAGFCAFFYKLNCCLASSATSEDMLAAYGRAWTTHRNVLGLEKTTQLLKIRKNLREESVE